MSERIRSGNAPLIQPTGSVRWYRYKRLIASVLSVRRFVVNGSRILPGKVLLELGTCCESARLQTVELER